MSNVTLTVSRTDEYTVETTEADIRAACDQQGIPQDGIDLDTLLERIGDSVPGELVLAHLVTDAESNTETWALDEWETEDNDDTVE